LSKADRRNHSARNFDRSQAHRKKWKAGDSATASRHHWERFPSLHRHLARDERPDLRPARCAAAVEAGRDRVTLCLRDRTAGFRKLLIRVGDEARFPFPVHPHMLRHACGYKLANDGQDTRCLTALSRTQKYSACGAIHRPVAGAIQVVLGRLNEA
jgi:hypothetical protein